MFLLCVSLQGFQPNVPFLFIKPPDFIIISVLKQGTLAENRCNKLQSDMLALKMLSGWGKNLNSTVMLNMVKWVWMSSLRNVIHLNTFSALLYVICDKKTEYFVAVRTWKYCSVQHQNFYWNLKNSLYNMYIITPWLSK